MGSCESRLDNCVPLDERIVLDAKAPPRAYLLVVDDPSRVINRLKKLYRYIPFQKVIYTYMNIMIHPIINFHRLYLSNFQRPFLF